MGSHNKVNEGFQKFSCHFVDFTSNNQIHTLTKYLYSE